MKSSPATTKTSRPGISDPGLLLMRHVVTARNAKPVYRGAHDRNLHSLKIEYRFDNNVPNRLREQTRLSILSWNQGVRRGREGAIEEHIAGKWHVIALQEAIEYLQHMSLTNHFDITHFASCAVVLNKDIFHVLEKDSSVDTISLAK